MHINRITMALLVCASMLAGCREDEAPEGSEGKVMLTAAVSSDMSVSRASATEADLADNCLIWISNSKGLVRKYQGLSAVPADGISLLTGHYTAEGWTGDSVPASFEDRYFTGATGFDVTAGNVTRVTLTCRIANTAVEVSYTDDVDQVLTDYSLTVGHSDHNLVFEGRDTRRGYYMMSSRSKDLTWTLTGKKADGSEYTRTGVIENARRSTLYTINVSYTGGEGPDIGGAYLSIEVDETAIVVEDEVEIELAPDIRGVGFDITEGLRAKPGSLSEVSLYIPAAAALESVKLSGEDLMYIAGFSAQEVDVLTSDDTYRESLAAKGIEYQYNYVAESDKSAMKLTFKNAFLSKLGIGRHTFTVTAADADGRSSSAEFSIIISEGEQAAIEVNAVGDADVWAYTANVTGKLNTAADSYGFRYRKQGESTWSGDVAATLSGKALKATITGLEAGTTYELIAYADDNVSETTVTFTTEAASQLPNAGFESTFQNGSILYFGDSLDNLFWDTGNTGSSTLNKNVTESDTSVKHGGNQSVRLSSQFVGFLSIGKFAAGNLFIGKYLKTQGTDGVLGWGRPFTSRPKALHGWIKYTPATVEYENADYDEIKKGDLDKGIIYIALLTDKTEEFEGSSFPVIVKTKNDSSVKRQLFDKNADNVIAYGEQIWSSATAGEGMVEFTIDLSYYRTDIKPSNIMLVAAASKGGDYFTGGKSQMWIDDLELIY